MNNMMMYLFETYNIWKKYVWVVFGVNIVATLILMVFS